MGVLGCDKMERGTMISVYRDKASVLEIKQGPVTGRTKNIVRKSGIINVGPGPFRHESYQQYLSSQRDLFGQDAFLRNRMTDTEA